MKPCVFNSANFQGFRVPFTIVSPWTRGGNVFTEMSDHNSQIMFVGKSRFLLYVATMREY